MRRIVLAGNPNAGKSTLFNSLTGGDRRVGNWHGVTVDEGDGVFYIGDEKVALTDLPGLYTVKGSDNEKSVAEKFLTAGDYDAIAVVTEAKTVKRAARLVGELKIFGKPIVIFVNLVAEFEKRGGFVDVGKLALSAGVPVFAGEAINRADADRFKTGFLSDPPLPKAGDGNDDFVVYPDKQRRSPKLNPVFASIAFVAAVFFTFYFAFGRYSPITFLSGFISDVCVEKASNILKTALYGRVSPFLIGLITDGILVGVCSVLAFLPQTAALSLALNLLDSCGFLSYASAFADGALAKVGLSGRAVYTLAGGFGCTALATETSLSIEDPGVRKRTIAALPFVSCSAKTPVYAFVASQIFGVDAFCVLSVIYLASVALPLLYSFILYKTVIGEKPRPIATEIAEFRKPDVFTAFKSLLKTLGRFIIKLGTVVMLSSVAFYILGAISPDLRFLRIDEADDSVLAVIGRALSFLLLPIGIKDWRYTAAIVGGVFAKESVVSTLAKLFPHGLMLGAASGVGFVVFVYLYTPCVTALAAIRRRAGLKRMLLTAFGQLLYAVVFSHFAYLAVSLFL